MPTITDHAIATPDKPAFIMGSSGEMVTFAELNAWSQPDRTVAPRLGRSDRRTHRHDAKKLP